jgi:hypothetical protein
MLDESRLCGLYGGAVSTAGLTALNLVSVLGLYTLLALVPGRSSVATVVAVGFGPTAVLSGLNGYRDGGRWGSFLLGIAPAFATLVIVLVEERFFDGQAETLGIALLFVLLLGLVCAAVGHAVGRALHGR